MTTPRRTNPTNPRALRDLRLPSGRRVLVTCSGLVIGLRYSPPARDQGAHAERVQDLLLWGRPLAHDQVLVAAMCTQGRRP